MDMNLDLFTDILKMDSTSSKEGPLASFLAERLATPASQVRLFDNGDGTSNVLFSWGKPEIVFCTHLDTVPPYIPPSITEDPDGELVIKGRGSCDAKGQIFSMYSACLELEETGYDGFGLLLLAGEETGSKGARKISADISGRCVIVGEPTDNKVVSASKGTKSFEVTIKGKSSHSGYPQYGDSAVIRFVDFVNRISSFAFPHDDLLGETTWNIGMLESPNPQNILSDRLSFRIYFRTTFASDAIVCALMQELACGNISVTPYGGDSPSRYLVPDGFPTATVAFGSDAPHLTGFRHKMLYGAGSILVAHTDREYVRLKDLEKAKNDYVRIFKMLDSQKEV